MNRAEAETQMSALIERSLQLKSEADRSEVDLKINTPDIIAQRLISEEIVYKRRLAEVLEKRAEQTKSKIVDEPEPTPETEGRDQSSESEANKEEGENNER